MYRTAAIWTNFNPINGTLATDSFDIKNNLSVYPNPTTGIISVSNQDMLAIDKVEIIDVFGKTVMITTTINSQIDLGGLPQGVYIFKIHSKETIFVKKIIKQ